MSISTLILVLGDQLNLDAPVLSEADKTDSLVLMAESETEITRYPNHKHRVVLFLAAMRNFAEQLKAEKYNVQYLSIDDQPKAISLPQHLKSAIQDHKPEIVRVIRPGDYHLEAEIRETCEALDVKFDLVEDPSFLSTPEEFGKWANGRKQLVMEYFYREMRKKHDILMESGKPVGGQWNYDEQNRESFDKSGPDQYEQYECPPDQNTQAVIELVNERFGDLPGTTENFNWPVTRDQALGALDHFVEYLLPDFGTHQDAMWTDEPFLAHSKLAAAINLKLLNPREVIYAALDAYESQDAPINSVEGFVRQILGWREYMRGIYWHHMPKFEGLNALDADEPLPELFWDGKTEMHCLSQVVGQLLQHAYAHHIQRLMVTGLFGLLYGVKPREINDWYLGYYIDSVEWVTTPNTIGMSQFADGGIVATKPYIASGNYINKMSNYCTDCRFDPKKAHGNDACPFKTLYWEFLHRHRDKFAGNQRMGFQIRNLDRKADDELDAILDHALIIREKIGQASL